MRAWIEALRSGEYRQGLKSLRQSSIKGGSSRFCCLGVAVDVYAKSTGLSPWHQTPGRQWTAFDMHSVLPKQIREWFGLIDSDPVVLPSTDTVRYVSCVDANDTNLWSFRKIADALEKQYLAPGKKDKKVAAKS